MDCRRLREGNRICSGRLRQFLRVNYRIESLSLIHISRSMKDREKAEELNARAGKLIEEGTAWADRIYAKVLDQLR